MNDGMKIILERMKTHPEEFKYGTKNIFSLDESKWLPLIKEYEDSLPKEDMKAFKEAIDVMRQEQFTAKVMEELLDPKSEQLELDLNPRQTPRMPSGMQTLSVSTSSTSLKELLAEKAELHALKNQHADIFKKPKKEHKTIFGKLFNYS
jgi:hypothetical protein